MASFPIIDEYNIQERDNWIVKFLPFRRFHGYGIPMPTGEA